MEAQERIESVGQLRPFEIHSSAPKRSPIISLSGPSVRVRVGLGVGTQI